MIDSVSLYNNVGLISKVSEDITRLQSSKHTGTKQNSKQTGDLLTGRPDDDSLRLLRTEMSCRLICRYRCLTSVVQAARMTSRLDRFWSLHDFVYDYRASPLDIGVTVVHVN